jgi:hypothetical chaperone protein
MALACGLDFGTSNSAVAIVEGGQPVLMPIESPHPTIPTALFFHADDDAIAFGREAIADYADGVPGRQMRSLKRILGTELIHEKTRLGASSIALSDVIGIFLRHLKLRAEAAAGSPIDNVVIGRPVRFVTNNPGGDAAAEAALGDIARKAGFANVEFQFEPIAAATTYQTQVQERATALIVDAGGGTSDFSIVELGPMAEAGWDDRGAILANHGVRVGGTDFDASLALFAVMPLIGYRAPLARGGTVMPSWVYADLAAWPKINSLYTHRVKRMVDELRRLAVEPVLAERLANVLRQRLGHYILMRVEEAKITLTDTRLVDCPLDAIEPGLSASISANEFENAIADETQAIFDGIAETVRLAGLGLDRIEKIFTTGGSTAIPAISRWIRARFPNAEIVAGDRFGSVAMGLALDAQRRFA